MKKLIAITSVLGFVAALAVSPAVATDDYVTVCLKQKKDGAPKKNVKLNRAAVGTDPGSACGKKQVEVTLPTDQLTNSLQSQITSNDQDIANNASDIADNKAAIESNDADILALQTKTTQNMNDIADNRTDIDQNTSDITNNRTDIDQNTSDIADNRTDIDQNTSDIAQNASDIADNQAAIDAIATVIGGGTGTTDLSTTDDTQYMGMFFSRTSDSDLAVENRIPVAGTLTSFWAKQTGDTTGDAARVYTVLLRAAPAAATMTALTCTIGAGDNVCADNTNCVDVVANRRISVEIDSSVGTGTLPSSKAQWSAKFTPGAACPAP